MAATSVVAFDTNALRAWIASDESIRVAVGKRSVVVPALVATEAMSGWLRLMEQHQRRHDERRFADALQMAVDLLQYLHGIQVLPYSPSAQRTFAKIRQSRGNRSRNDLRIAAICIAHDVPLLTRNLRDFENLPDLTIQTW